MDLMNKDIRGLQEYDVKPMICNMKFIGIMTGFCSGCGLISLIQATFLTGMFDNPLSYSDETKVLKKQEPQNKLNEIYNLFSKECISNFERSVVNWFLDLEFAIDV